MTLSTPEPAIDLDKIVFAYPGGAEMRFALQVPAGARAALIGPSGSGKTTLLGVISGFLKPRQGQVRLMGRDVTGSPPSARPISMVFQDNNLFGHLDAWTNVALGLSAGLTLSHDDHKAIETALTRVGLEGYDKRMPDELSGGQKQRVALARVLVRRQPILLLDEPFAALGPALRRDMLELVSTLQQENKMTVLMITHQTEDVRSFSTHTVFLDDGRVAAFDKTRALLERNDLPALDRYMGTDS